MLLVQNIPKLTSVKVVQQSHAVHVHGKEHLFVVSCYDLKFYLVSVGGQFLCQLTIKVRS